MKTARSLLVLALLASAVRGDDWTHLGLDDVRSRAPAESIASPAVLGSVATGTDTASSPVAADGFLVTAGLDGVVRAYHESDRSFLWSVPTGSPVLSTPLVQQGRVYVPSTDGLLRILRLSDGGLLGSLPTGGSSHSSPVYSGGFVYLGSGFPANSLLAVDPVRMAVAWSAPLDQVSQSSAALAGGQVLIATHNGTLAAFDGTTGAPAWSASVGGDPGASSPIVQGGSVYLLAAGTLSRLDLGSGAVTGSVALSDTPPPYLLSVQWAGSSLAQVGGTLAGVVRFDYALDHTGAGVPDSWTLREFAFAVDPSSMALLWQTPLGSVDEVSLNQIPPFRFVPSPVSLGSAIAFASCLDASLRLLSPSGSLSTSLALDAPSLASPFLANARLYALTRSGQLFAFEDPAAPQPPAVTGLSPSGGFLAASPATLSWNSAGPGASYLVRISGGGDLYMSWDQQFVTSQTSVPCPVLATGTAYVWGVRVQNPALAYAPWALARFAVDTAPAPPGSLTATPQHAGVLLSWTPSPSPSVTGYLLQYGPTGGALGSPVPLGNVSSAPVGGLTDGTSYTFCLSAVDALGDASTPVAASATPLAVVQVAGTAFSSVVQALASAQPGDTVMLAAGTIQVPSTLEVPPGVTLEGVNGRDTALVATGPIVLVEASDGSTVRMLSLSGGAVGISVTGTGVTIDHCVIYGMVQEGILVSGSALVVNNTIVGNGEAGILATGPVSARNNIIQGNGVGLSGTIVSTYNDVSDGYASGSVAGTGDRSQPVSFEDPASGDYREQPHQASLDAGDPADDFSQEPSPNGGRINMGAFGDTPLAAPSLPPPSAPSSSSPGCGLLGFEAVLLWAAFRRRR